MSEFKFTKGEWKINKYNNVISKYELPIAVVYDGDTAHNSFKESDAETCKANAKLISCAPSMLEMLEKISSTLKKGNSVNIDSIDELIKKATI